MTTHSSTQALPGIGAPTAPRANLRAYLAGTGATSALIAGLVIVFLAAGAFVAFNGFPFADDSGSDSVTIGAEPTAGPPEAAALALRGGPDAVAPAPTTLIGGPDAAVDGGAAFAAATGPGGFGSGGGGAAGTVPPGAIGSGGGGAGGAATSGGALGDTVGVVDDATNNLGLPLNLGRTTGPLTQGLDRTVTDTLNQVGGSNGPRLGDRVNDTVHGVRDGLNRGLGGLGPGG